MSDCSSEKLSQENKDSDIIDILRKDKMVNTVEENNENSLIIRYEELDDEGWTPLHHAAFNGQLGTIHKLKLDIYKKKMGPEIGQK